jgi:hypothetical protein
MPNIPLLAGATVSGLVGNAWYPEHLRTTSHTAQRIAGSLGTALAASFYNEFQPEVGRVLGRLFRRGATPPATSAPGADRRP